MMQRLLLLGEYDVGKSHFGGQLLGRLNREQGALRMVGAPPTLGPFETVLNRLNGGRAAPHTPQSQYVESIWPLADGAGRQLQLHWPDYGGEQLGAIRRERAMPQAWRDRICRTTGWIVMIRVAHHQLSDDIFTRPLAKPGKERSAPDTFAMSSQAQVVDLLQWMMFVRGTGTLAPVATPPLTLLLSCWDELPRAEQAMPPCDVLRARMPMVAAFLEANWQAGAHHVLGVSALERPLSEEQVDEEFIDRGPEAFGYVVLEDGSHDPDLTLAIAGMM